MRQRLFLAAIGAALVGSAAILPAAAAPQAAPQQRDWAKTVAETPEGGFRMGNPNAAVKLVEYGSLGCPTCARFAAESHAPLLAQVRSGKVSFEFRNFVLNGPDLAASLLARCAGPAGFFRVSDAFFAAQPHWRARLQAVPQAKYSELQKLPPAQQIAQLASLGGLDAIAVKAGLAPARARQCLANPGPAIERLVAMKQAAETSYHVHGTPTFIVNGKPAEGVHSWAEVAPLLRRSGG